MQQAFTDLERFGAKSALIGGFAVSVRTKPRMTKDVDFSVAVADDSEAEVLIRSFVKSGYRIGSILEHEITGRLATARLYLPEPEFESTEPDIDLLFASCGIESEIVASATAVKLPSIGPLPTARIGHLISMKVLAESDRRAKDREDLNSLIAIASKRELELARKGCQLIEERGFARGKNLIKVLDGFVKRRRAESAEKFEKLSALTD